jgi:carbonic anhydrase/acetyltransferase-like protein (isoleucine patch superfamily)
MSTDQPAALSRPVFHPFAGHWPEAGERVFVEPSAVVIGQVLLGDDVSIWPQVTVRGDVNAIRIGARSNIQDGAVLHVTHVGGPQAPEGYPLIVGAAVTVGHRAILHGCAIGDRVIIGMGSIVMDGAVVEDEVVIAAGSLVPPGKRLLRGHLYKGSPVQRARPLSQAEIDYFDYSADHYLRLKDRYLTEA